MQAQAPDTLTTVPVASFASAPVPLSGIPTEKLPHEDLMGLPLCVPWGNYRPRPWLGWPQHSAYCVVHSLTEANTNPGLTYDFIHWKKSVTHMLQNVQVVILNCATFVHCLLATLKMCWLEN